MVIGRAIELRLTVAAKRCANVTALLTVLSADEALPEISTAMFKQMGQHMTDPDTKIHALEGQPLQQHKVSSAGQPRAALRRKLRVRYKTRA